MIRGDVIVRRTPIIQNISEIFPDFSSNIFIQNFNNQSNTGYQFSLEKFSENKLVEKLTADNIQWDSVKQKWTLRYWKRKKVDRIFQVTAVNSLIHNSDSLNTKLVTVHSEFETEVPKSTLAESLAEKGDSMDTTLIISPKDFENEAHKADGMTIPELGHQIEQLRFRGSTGVESYEVERHIRFAAPFTTFVLVFMGVIVSARKNRGGTGFQIALGFSLAFIFILFFTMTRTFAETGSLSPVVAAWLPNMVFGSISLIMYKFVPR